MQLSDRTEESAYDLLQKAEDKSMATTDQYPAQNGHFSTSSLSLLEASLGAEK